MQHRNVLLIAGGAAVLSAAVLVFVVLRSPSEQPLPVERAEAGAAAVPREAIPDRGIPALALSDEEPVGDAWRTFAPADGPFLTERLGPGDQAQARANLSLLGLEHGVGGARPFTRRHAAVVLAGLSHDQPLKVRRRAGMAIAALLEILPDLDPEIREVFREALLDYLGAENAIMADTLLASVQISPSLLRDEEVMERVREVSLRPGPHDEDWRYAVDRAIFIMLHRDHLIREYSRSRG